MSPRLTSRAKGPQLPDKQTTVFPLRRYGFVAGAVTILVILVSWVAVRAVEPVQATPVPLMIQPPIPFAGVEPPPIPSARASDAPSATPPAVVVLGVSRSPKPTTARTRITATTKPTPRRTTSPPIPAAAVSGLYTVGASWDRGFIGSVEVTNKSGTARTWTVKLTFDPSAGVGIGNTWNAQLSRQGNTFVFTGGQLAPGSKVSMGFEASKQVSGKIQPATCTIDGAPCQRG